MEIKLRAGVWSGIAAGVLSTLAQGGAWILFTDRFPELLFRDARLTAAVVLGRRVLPPPDTFDPAIMLTAGAVHFALSAAYGVALGLLLARWPRHTAAVGAGFGATLYLVNLYGFTVLFPWFAQVRDADTFMAHIVFGLAGAGTYRVLARRSAAGKASR